MTALDPSPAAGYTDVHLVEEPFPTICYCSGLCVYEESLVHGHLVGRA